VAWLYAPLPSPFVRPSIKHARQQPEAVYEGRLGCSPVAFARFHLLHSCPVIVRSRGSWTGLGKPRRGAHSKIPFGSIRWAREGNDFRFANRAARPRGGPFG